MRSRGTGAGAAWKTGPRQAETVFWSSEKPTLSGWCGYVGSSVRSRPPYYLTCVHQAFSCRSSLSVVARSPNVQLQDPEAQVGRGLLAPHPCTLQTRGHVRASGTSSEVPVPRCRRTCRTCLRTVTVNSLASAAIQGRSCNPRI